MLNKCIYSFLYALFTAISMALIADIKEIPITTSLLISTALASLFFHLVNIKKINRIYRGIFQHFFWWLTTCLLIFIMWWCTFYGAQSVGPAEFLLLFFTLNVASGYAYEMIVHRNFAPVQVWGFTGLLILTFLNYLVIQHAHKPALGFMVSCLGGLSGYIYSRISYHFAAKAQITATEVLAVRFYLLIAVLCFYATPASVLQALTHYGLHLSLITLFSFIIPLYFSQRGIAEAGPELNAAIIACTPLIMVVLLALFAHQFLLIQLLLGIAMVACIIPKLIKNIIRMAHLEK